MAQRRADAKEGPPTRASTTHAPTRHPQPPTHSQAKEAERADRKRSRSAGGAADEGGASSDEERREKKKKHKKEKKRWVDDGF